MNPEVGEFESLPKEKQDNEEGEKEVRGRQIDLFSVSHGILWKYHRTQMACVNVINILSKEQEPENDHEYRICIDYLETLALSSGKEGGPDCDFMTRLYGEESLLDKKVEMLEYYKFHRNVGMILSPNIEEIMGQYNQVKRKHQYKRLKKLLKKDHDISIKSLREDSSEEMATPSRSQYSNLISQLSNSQHSAQYQPITHQPTKKRNTNKLNQLQSLVNRCQQLDGLPVNSHRVGLTMKKKDFEEDLRLSRLLKRTPLKDYIRQASSRVKIVLSTSKVIPKKLIKTQDKTNKEKERFNGNQSIFKNMPTMKSELEFRMSQLASTQRKKELSGVNQSVDLKNKSTGVNQGSRSLHRKKSDVFLPTMVPDIKIHRINSASSSVTSNISVNSREKGLEMKMTRQKLYSRTLQRSYKSKQMAQILFRKLKLSK